MRNRSHTIWILGDQLSPLASSLSGSDKSDSVVFMAESFARAGKLPYHKQKLVLVWSAMRHYAEELREDGYEVDYYQAQPNLKGALRAHRKKYKTSRLRLMESAEYGISAQLMETARAQGFDVEITSNNLFLSDKDEFARRKRQKDTASGKLLPQDAPENRPPDEWGRAGRRPMEQRSRKPASAAPGARIS